MAFPFSAPFRRKSVTHVSGTFCYLCLGSLIKNLNSILSFGVCRFCANSSINLLSLNDSRTMRALTVLDWGGPLS